MKSVNTLKEGNGMKLALANINLGLWAAAYIKQTAQAFWAKHPQETFTLGLPTGGTVTDMYANLRLFYQTGALDFSRFVTFNMDEYAGLLPEHPQSYHSYMQQHLFSGVNIPPQNRHLLNGMTQDPAAECAAYEESIRQAGGIKLFVGGVGRNGHIAFNEPGSEFTSRTRLVELTLGTRQANARFFGNHLEKVPTHALTVGIGTLLDAPEILILADGPQKAQAVSTFVCNEPTLSCPLTALKLHANATLLIDKAAASLLPDDLKNCFTELENQNPEAAIYCLEL